MPQTWTVSAEATQQRLDVFLTQALPQLTRSQVVKYLKRGAGSVNGKLASVHQFLKAGEVVTFDAGRVSFEVSVGVPADSSTPRPMTQLEIVAETNDWLIVNKPSGLLVHPVTSELQRDAARHVADAPTLVDLLLSHAPKISKVGDNLIRPGIVHRLDRDTSGLMVIAKTQTAFDNLKQQFTQHAVDKRYLALVYGQMPLDEGDIKFRIARSKTKARMAARPQHEAEGKAAWTHYKVLRRWRTATLLELTILSGRTHQIRAHLLALNHPILGDPLYKRRSSKRSLAAPRLMLQSTHLGFRDPTTGEKTEFDLPAAPDFQSLIRVLV